MRAQLKHYLAERQIVCLAFLGFCIELACMFLVLWFPLPALSQHVGPLDLKGMTHYSPLACGVYVLVLGVLFVCWWQAWRFANNYREQTGDRGPLVLVYALIFAGTLGLMYPINATDLFQYVFRGRVFAVYHGNPLVLTPRDFPADPILPYVGEWTYIPSPYGPVWELLAGIVTWLCGGRLLPTLLGLKALVIAFYLGTAFLVERLLSIVAPEHRVTGMLFFAWNPLILLELIGNGHNDAVMLFFVVLGFYLLARKRALLSILSLMMAVLCKVIALLIIPPALLIILRQYLTWRERVRFLAKAGAVAMVVGLILYLPFWPPWESISGVLGESTRRWGFSIPTLCVLVLQAMVERLGVGSTRVGVFVVYELPRWIVQGLFVVLYLRLLMHAWRERTVSVVIAFRSLFTYLLLAPSFRVWYPTWLVPLAALQPGEGRAERAAIFGFTAALSVVVYGYVWGWLRAYVDHLGIHAMAVPLVFIPPLVLSPLLRRRRTQQEL